MKYLGLILVVALVAGQVLARRINENDGPMEHSRVQRGMNDKFRKFLETLKTDLREGNENLGIPKIDPFEGDFLDAKFDDTLLKGNGTLIDFQVLGMADYKVKKAEISVFSRKMTIGLRWPQIYSRGLYNMNVSALNKYELWGNGTYEVTAKDLSFETVVSLNVFGGVSIKSMQSKISLRAVELSLTGFYEDKDLSVIASKTIADMLPQLVQDHQRKIVAIVNAKIIKIANKKLAGKSLSDILAILG